MPTQDEDFIKRLRATFEVEAQEHLQAMAAMLLDLEKSPATGQAATTVENVYREAHSLKGAARAVDLVDVEAICQALEGVFSTWKRQEAIPSAASFDALHRTLDTIRSLIASTQPQPVAGAQRQRDELIHLLGGIQSSAPPPPRTQPAPSPPPASHPADVEKSTAAETVRIATSKLDARLLEAEDMLIVKAMAAQRATELREIVAHFDQWRREWAKASASVRWARRSLEQRNPANGSGTATAMPAALLSFLDWNTDYLRSMENRLTVLASRAEQDRHGISKRVNDLLEDSKKLLMLPFSTLASIFPKLIRDLCRDQNKEADVVVRGGEIEIDKRILEEMKDALIHILRNCVDHGVELPEERARQGKPTRATIHIAVSPVNGNKMEIVVSDDGAGVNLDRVKQSAIRHGVIQDADARAMRDADAMSLIFHSEVSTSPIVTAISGRGLGMAIVREKAEKLGGRVAVQSTPHGGTTLRLLLPLTLATFRGVLVTAADRTFVIPTTNVERVALLRPQDIQTIENRETISMQGRVLSLARLQAVLGLPAKSNRRDSSDAIPAVIIHWGDQHMAFAVDAVLHEEEVLVKPLRKPLMRVRNIAGATVLASGSVVPILNVTDLMKSAQTFSGTAAPATSGASAEPPSPRTVLVVEDSVTSRMLLKSILESADYQVRTAVDGVEAFATLREVHFDLLVSDVEMPRMNGFDLTAKVRADKRLADLPVVLVTALESREERERGIDVGANAYIVKSSFDQSNLLDVIRRLM